MAARLPDASVLKGEPRFDPGGITPRASVDGIGRGQMIAARGIQQAGEAIARVGSAIDSVNAANEKMEFLKADSLWNVAKVEESTKLAEDSKYDDLPQRHEEALRARREAALANITNPRAKEMFILKTEDEIARSKAAAIGRAKGLEGDANRGWLDQQHVSISNSVANEQDTAKRVDMITSHRALIRSFVDKGWLNHEKAFAEDRKFANTLGNVLAETGARRGEIDKVISDLDAAALNAANQPAPVRPVQRLGELSAKYESKGNPAAAGPDNIGYAYGLHQLNSRGSLKEFLSDHPEYAKKFAGLNPESDAFVQRWRQVAKEDGEKFADAQQQTFEKHARPSMERATALGFKMDDRGVVESVLSGSIQHGKWTQVLAKAAATPGFSGMSAEDQVKTLYKARADYVTNLGTIDDTTRAGVLNRYRSEIKDALGMVGQPVGEPVKVASADPNFVPTPPQKPTAEAGALTQAQRAPTVYDAMDPLAREQLRKHMIEVRDRQQRERASETLKASAERGEQYERRMLDASVGKGELPAREEIEADPTLNDAHKNTVLRQWGTYAKDTLAFKSAFDRFTKGEPFNPYESEDRKNADRIFKSMNGDDAALTNVIQRTGILPESAATKMRADLISNDPKRVIGAMTRASNAITMNQNIMTGFDGAADLEKNAVKFRTYVDDFGMTAEDAANRMIREQTPEFKNSVNAKLKNENIDDLIKKEVTVDDMAGQFDNSLFGIAPNPKVGFSVRTRDAMFDQFASLTKEHYLDMASGDLSLAKKLAANDLKKTWGTSSVNGSTVVMQYPPERAPVYQGLEKASDLIAKEAIKAIKDETGQDVDQGSLRIVPIPGVTAQAYKAGQVPPYALSWTDKNGTLQMLRPGRAFVADPAAMRQAQTLERETSFGKASEAAQAERIIGADPRVPFGVPQ